uniref:Uncharacterized protein n=1 Tax=Neogobius melanostomus TaxID=47308 RepID=A0A8C6TTC6_9GOBI
MSQFSQYVSFYNPCPPVQRYVSSLQNQISCVLIDYANNWTPNRPDTTTTTTTVDLASRVSEFVSSIRAANDDALPEAALWQTDTEGEVATSSMDYLDNTIQANVVSSDRGMEMDGFGEGISSNGRRQVQFSSNHIEICIRNEPEHSSGSSGDVEEAGDARANATSPPLISNQGTLNSLIHELQPEVYTNLVEIIKDLKRNTQHFYIHCAEEDDYTIQQIRVQLLKQSYIEKSPVLFLNQEENSNGKLLVVIKNQDIAAHIHQIPELLSLKRRPTVQFLGMDSAEDLRNHSYQDLFVSGGQVLSDEMVLNPDCVSHDKLSALLSVLEKHSSAENLWRWKVHCKTHKKLREQSRFRRDAASLLEVLLSFQRKQIVDFLPFHKCDMSQGCELLDCAVELQGRYSNYRHTVVLTENRLQNSSNGGVIVCGIDEFLHDFRKLVAYNDDIPQPISEEPQSTEDPSQSDLVPSEDVVPGAIPLHSEQDFAVLHRAISQLRAERRQQLSDTNSDRQGAVSTTDVSTTSVFTAEQRPFTPPSDKVSAIEAVQLTSGRQAVAATLDLIHTSLQPADEDRTPRNQPRIQVQTQLRTVDHRRSPESQVPLVAAGQRQSPGIPDQTHDLTTTQSRVQVVTQVPIDRRRSPENKVPVDSIGHRTSTNSQVQAIDQIPSDSGDRRRLPATQVLNLDRASTQSRAPTNAQQLLIDHKQSLEAQVQVPTGGGGSQGRSVPSAPQSRVAVPGKSEPASAPVRPPAPNTSLNQSRVNQEKTQRAADPPQFLLTPPIRPLCCSPSPVPSTSRSRTLCPSATWGSSFGRRSSRHTGDPCSRREEAGWVHPHEETPGAGTTACDDPPPPLLNRLEERKEQQQTSD